MTKNGYPTHNRRNDRVTHTRIHRVDHEPPVSNGPVSMVVLVGPFFFHQHKER